VLVASIRHTQHVLDSATLGADVATIPYGVLKKMFKHPLTDAGIISFNKDWEKVKALGK
jgi:transaldolase